MSSPAAPFAVDSTLTSAAATSQNHHANDGNYQNDDEDNGEGGNGDVEIIEDVIWANPLDKFASHELAPRPRLEYPDPCGCMYEDHHETNDNDNDTSPTPPPSCCRDESCVLHACQEECHECLPFCANQRITKKQTKQVELFDAGLKGKGLRAAEFIPRGSYICEYVGRAIRRAFLERLFGRYKNERMLYIMALDSNVFIDARKQGGVARYINHSCAPTCVVERWKVRGVLRAGIFARKDIAVGEELTFDYQWDRKRGRAPTKCHCMTPQCRGTLEVPKSMEEEALEKQLTNHWRTPPSRIAGHEIINRSIRIYSPIHAEYFAADVCKYDPTTQQHLVMYRNNSSSNSMEEAWEDLRKEEWQILDEEAEAFVIRKKDKQQSQSSSSLSSSALLLSQGDVPPQLLLQQQQQQLNGAVDGQALHLHPSQQQQQQQQQLQQPMLQKDFVNFFHVTTDVKGILMQKGFLTNVGRRFGCSVDTLKIIANQQPNIAATNNPDVTLSLEDIAQQQLVHAISESTDGLVWKITISGVNVHPACGFLEKNILKLRQRAQQQQYQQKQQLQQYDLTNGSTSATMTGTISTNTPVNGPSTAFSNMAGNSGSTTPGTPSTNTPSSMMNGLVTEELIIPRVIVDMVQSRLSWIRDKIKNVNIMFAHSESKSKQFARVQLSAQLLTDIQQAQVTLWTILNKFCEEVDAPKVSNHNTSHSSNTTNNNNGNNNQISGGGGLYKDLGFYGGQLPGDQFQMLFLNGNPTALSNASTTSALMNSATSTIDPFMHATTKDRLNQDANEDLRKSSFFASFEATQRCTVWIQAQDDMGRIDASNRVIAEFNPNAPRKVYFGVPTNSNDATNSNNAATPANQTPIYESVSKLWGLVEQRGKDLARGIRYLPLGADRVYQPFMMKKSGKFFEFIQQITGSTVTLDSMTGDHLRIDGGAGANEVISIGDWDSEHSLTSADRAQLAEELIHLQIEVYRDHCIRQQNWIFGRDWSLATSTTTSSSLTTGSTDAKSDPSTVGGVTTPVAKSPRSLLTSARGNRFEPRTVANGCMEVAEIVMKMTDMVDSVSAHATVIMYRFLKLTSEHDDAINLGFKMRDIVMACLFLANKAQKVNKWKKLDTLLEVAYPVFFPGSKFNRKEQEAANFEQKVICAESEILKTLNYDVFWKGVDWVVEAAKNSVAAPLAENAVNHVLSGPVLAAGADLWLKYDIEYIFAAVAGFLSIDIEPLFEALSLIPLKVYQAAQLIVESISTNSSSRKSSRPFFNGGEESFVSNLAHIKSVCMLSMAKNFRASKHKLVGGENFVRYKLIGQRDNRRVKFQNIDASLVDKAILPIIDAVCAESKCRVFVAESEILGCEDVVLEGSWRALAIAEVLLAAVCEHNGGMLPQPTAQTDEDSSFKFQSKTHSGRLIMDDIGTTEGWQDTIQSKIVADSLSYGRKVGGKACVAGRIQENDLRLGGLRWWIPPSFAPSLTGSLYEMHCVRNGVSTDDVRLGHLIELSALAHSLLGHDVVKNGYPMLSLFFRPKEEKSDERFVAVSMQRWPPEKIGIKEQGKAGCKSPSTGFSPAALQELQLLTQLHSLIPSPMGHPNFTLPVAIAMPQEGEENSESNCTTEFGKAKVEEIFSLFRSSEENERSAQKEKRRRNRASGPHVVFNPIPFILTRVLHRSGKKRRDKADGTISPSLFSAWFHDLLSALVHCHTNHVIIRSSQADQIVIDHSGVAKLAGFYRATVLPLSERDVYVDPYRYCSKHRKDRSDKGDDGDESTNPYAAPELLLGSLKHTKETDVWAIGSIMAHLLLGKPMFVGKERKSILMAMYKIIGTPASNNYPESAKFPYAFKPEKKYKRAVEKAFQHLMEDADYQKHEKAVDLISKMLHLDPRQRISAVDALKHDYMHTYVENCTTKDFREQYVSDWMAMKKELVHSNRNDENDAKQRERNMKRKAMLEVARADAGTGDEMDDLYDMSDTLGGEESEKRPKILD